MTTLLQINASLNKVLTEHMGDDAGRIEVLPLVSLSTKGPVLQWVQAAFALTDEYSPYARGFPSRPRAPSRAIRWHSCVVLE
jgi:hypothetical protein